MASAKTSLLNPYCRLHGIIDPMFGNFWTALFSAVLFWLPIVLQELVLCVLVSVRQEKGTRNPNFLVRILAHRNRSDFCDLRLRCPSRTPEIARFPRQEKAMLHCDLRLRWKVASDLRFRAAISEPKTHSFCGISGDLAPSTRKSLAIAIVRFWCAKVRIFSGGVGVFHVNGWGAKVRYIPRNQANQTFWAGYPGILPGYPGIARKV